MANEAKITIMTYLSKGTLTNGNSATNKKNVLYFFSFNVIQMIPM